MRSTSSRLFAWLAVLLIAAWILSMTLAPGLRLNSINLTPFSRKSAALECLLAQDCLRKSASARFLFIDVLGNIAVFVPFGAALAAATSPRQSPQPQRRAPAGRWWLKVVALGCLFSLSIELAQLTIRARATDIDDVIFNTLGTALGALLVIVLRRRGDW